MFGYIRPLKSELKVREFEQFKACYCGLCHALAEKYGHVSRYVLNYDLTFLAMLLWDESCPVSYEQRRCPVSPLKKRHACGASAVLAQYAGYSVILSYWKLRDNIADEGFFGKVKARAGLLALGRAYRLAKKEHEGFARAVRDNLAALAELEKSGDASLDRMADRFARILAEAAHEIKDPGRQRVLEQILYHTGRWIFIADAVNDLSEDLSSHRYNAVAARFHLEGPDMTEEVKETLRRTMENSVNLIGSAFELTEENPWSAIIRNIIYLGMSDICAQVLNGTFQKPKERHPL